MVAHNEEAKMKEKTIFFDYGVVEEAKRRAAALNVNYEDILARNGLSMRILASARGAYGRAAVSKGYKQDANIAIMDEQKFNDLCTGFMVNPEDYLLESPPMEEKPQVEKPQPERVQTLENEDLLLCLEELTRSIRANTVQITNLREQNRTEHKESLAKLPDERKAKALEDISMALKTTNRALDAIDNKLNTAVSSMQRLESKLDKNTNAALDSANKLKAVVEGVGGLLTKVTRICALYERPRAK